MDPPLGPTILSGKVSLRLIFKNSGKKFHEF
jgi:hypothetical protein